MVFGCICSPFRRLRRCKKSTATAQLPPRCPSCMEPCLPVPNALGDDPTVVVDAKHSEPPIVVPCQQTYHAECLRDFFNSTVTSSPYHPPRCCGYFIPLSMLYTLYSNPPPPPPPPETSPTEKGAATEEISEKSASTAPKNDTLAYWLAAFRDVTDNPVDCYKCKKWVLPQDIDEDKETAHCNPKFGGCGATTCVICNGPAHPPPSPPKGKAAKFASKPGCTKVNDEERGEVRFKRLVGREGWRQCGKCGWMLSRDTGCCEVICRCGHYETLAF